MKLFNIWIVSVIILLVLDAIWIISMSGAYKQQYSRVQCKKLSINRLYLVVSYTFMALALYLVLSQIKNKKDKANRIITAALWGLVIYGVYNFVNAATFTDYNIGTAIMDTLWGAFVVAASTNIALFVFKM